MTNRIYGLAIAGLLAVLAPAAGAQEPLRCDPASLDFGRRPLNQVFTAQATLTNITAERVRITGVQADCGCVSADATLLDLGPGQSTPLTVRMQSGGLEGDFRHQVTVSTVTGPGAALEVRMAVFRYANWSVNPSRLLFAPSAAGTEVASDLRIARVGAMRLGILSVACDSPYLAVTSQGATENAIVYRVTKLRSAPMGPIYSDIRIATDDATAPELDIPVFAYVTAK